MQITQKNRSPTVFKALLMYFSVLFFWQVVFSYFRSKFDNVHFLIYAATAASIYWIAKTTLKPNFLGRPLKSSDSAEIVLVSTATVLSGVGCWSLLVFLDVALNGHRAIERWGLISSDTFSQMNWSIYWFVGDLITSSFFAPITEEIVFRVFVLQRLRDRYSTVISVTTSAGLFAALHFDKSFIGAFIHGLIFAVLVIRTSSIYASILVHGVYNATMTALTVLFGFSIVGDATKLSKISYWVPEFSCGLIGLLILTIYFWVWSFRPNVRT